MKFSYLDAGGASPAHRDFCRAFLHSFDLDWEAHGFDAAHLDELVEHMLRLIQSLVLDPGEPPRLGASLVSYLELWLRPGVEAIVSRVGVAG